MRVAAALAVGVWAVAGLAQGTRPEPVGAVTGHVVCGDTQRPARLAEVKLVRVPTAADLKGDQSGLMKDTAPAGDAVQTSLDGSYIVRNVKPGRYYVVVDKEGYLLPLGQFSKKELAATDDETKARVAKAAHTIDVEANQTAKEDVELERGASVSGTVSYDDGTPASGIGITLLTKDKDGKWVEAETQRYRSFHSMGFGSTDDNGNYRMTGLPAGEYATEANLALNDFETTLGPMPGNPNTMMQMTMMKTRYSLPLYSGDVLRKSAATGYTLGIGEARAGSDLVFPLAKLHRVDGQVETKGGHAVNGGNVKLAWADDKSEMTEAAIQFDDQAFHMDYVPEGDFLLQVSGAKDVTKVQVENPAGYTPKFHEEEKTVKSYGDTEQALTVKGDVSDVMVVVPEAGKANAP
jgi:hypothetical protein